MRISVTKTITADRQGREIEGKPKSGRNRIVPIPGFLTADLEQVCDGRTDDDYLFTALHGGDDPLEHMADTRMVPSQRRGGLWRREGAENP